MTMPVPFRRPPPAYPCRTCRVRWISCWSGTYAGLCRRCAIEAGAVLPSTNEIEAERVRRARSTLAAKRIADTGPRPDREIVVNHEHWIVVWDGT